MSETTERLDVAERRYDIAQIVLSHGSSSTLSQLHRLSESANDVPYLIDLARKQAAALGRVEARLDEWAAMKPFPDAEETQVWYSAGRRHASEAIRAELEEKS